MHDVLQQACNDRDELRRRVLRIATTLGISPDGFSSDDVQAQWLELCDRIDEALAPRRVININ